jgi:uncharacterized protein (DUF1501 family)
MSIFDPGSFCNDPRHVRPSRREFLYVGLAGGLGMTLGNYLQAAGTSPAVAATLAEGKAKSLIHIFLPGGISAHESFDPKPDAPLEYRGPFGTVKTKLEGEVFSENLKETAGIADKITVVRSMTHGEAAHERGTHNMFTGYRPSPALLPPYICVPSMPNPYAGSGFLSSAYGPFSLGNDPANGSFTVRDLSLPSGVDAQRFEQRKTVLAAVDDHFRKLEKSDALDSMDTFYQRAYALISSKEAREAFNLSAEPAEIKEKYGKNAAGMRMLMARRLVESGVRRGSLTYGGWDHHSGITNGIKTQLPAFDKAFAALISDLDQRGILDSTLVMVSSEFGRTPKVNKDDGRDHWPKVFSIVLAGGGIKRGQIYGTSDATGGDPADNPLALEDLSATLFHQLGIQYDKKLISPGGRPIDIVRNGHPVEGLIA